MKKCENFTIIETIIMTCPYCKSDVSEVFVDVPESGDVFKCGTCGKEFKL